MTEAPPDLRPPPDLRLPARDGDLGLAGEVARFLCRLAGVRAAVPIPPAVIPDVLAAEERYESEAALPIENLGMRSVLRLRHVVVLLKDGAFRGPPAATLYLIEEGDAPAGEVLAVEGRRYHVIGEETVAEGERHAAGGIAISGTFFLYPERRADAALPSRFLLPPLPFSELLEEPWSSRLRSVLSASPSPLADLVLRRSSGFPEDPSLATLAVGFDPAGA